MIIDQYSFTLCSQKIEDTNTLLGPLVEPRVIITMQECVLTRTQQGWQQVGLLLQSAPHSRMTRVLHECQAHAPIISSHRYTLGADHGSYDLRLIETSLEIDSRSAATHALLFACWWGDMELVRWLVRDLRNLIDADTLIDGRNILEWAIGEVKDLDFDQESYVAHLDCAMDICRYLIISFKLTINANLPSGIILHACTYGHGSHYTDIIAHLVRSYGKELIHSERTHSIFEMLVESNYEEEALMYLDQHRDLAAGTNFRILGGIFLPLAREGSASIFKLMLGMFGSQMEPTGIDRIFKALCYNTITDGTQISFNKYHDKIEAALSVWASKLTPKIVETCLVDYWGWNTAMKQKTAELVIRSCLDQLEDQGISIALALTCSQNLELFDEVFDRKLEQIQAKPKLLKHAALEFCSFKDIEALAHILDKCGFLIYRMALKFWAAAGDLDAIIMILELITDISMVAKVLPGILLRACYKGDIELAELIINFAGDSIDKAGYDKAFRYACYGSCEDIIQTLATKYRNYFDYRSDDEYGLNPIHIEHKIVNLLNSIYDTTLKPSQYWFHMRPPCLLPHVKYNNARTTYNLYKLTKTAY